MSIWPNKPTEAEAKPNDPPTPPEKTTAELISESINPMNSRLSALEGVLNEIRDSVKRPAKPEGSVEQPQPISVLDDENAAFTQRMTPLLLRQLELESRVVKNDIKAEYEKAGYGDLWEKHAEEIEKLIDQTPLVNVEGKVLRGDPQYVRNVVDMVFGRAAKKAGMRFDGKSKGFFLETATSGDSGRPAPEEDGLSEGQRKVMQRMHIGLDDAKKVMAKLQFVK